MWALYTYLLNLRYLIYCDHQYTAFSSDILAEICITTLQQKSHFTGKLIYWLLQEIL